jgi:hypothetical protein
MKYGGLVLDGPLEGRSISSATDVYRYTTADDRRPTAQIECTPSLSLGVPRERLLHARYLKAGETSFWFWTQYRDMLPLEWAEYVVQRLVAMASKGATE